MIRLFKDLRIKYYCVEIIGIVMLVLLNEYIKKTIGTGVWYYLIVFITLFYAIAVAIFFLSKSIQRLTIISKEIEQNQNLRKNVEKLEELFKRAKNKKTKSLIFINLIGVYVDIGETKKAIELCNQFEPVFDSTPIGIQNRIIYMNNNCEICIKENLFSLAHQHLSVLNKLIETTKLNTEQQKYMKQIYSDLVIELVFREDEIKDYESIEKYYLKRFKEEQKSGNKIFFAYQLSLVYHKLNKKDKEKEYKNYYEKNRGELEFH